MARLKEPQALKFDGEKLPYDLIPKEFLDEVAKVLAFGVKKYDRWNWAHGFQWSRLYASVARHVFAHQAGEDLDPESGHSHLSHAACGIMFLVMHEQKHLGMDDRFRFEGNGKPEPVEPVKPRRGRPPKKRGPGRPRKIETIA